MDGSCRAAEEVAACRGGRFGEREGGAVKAGGNGHRVRRLLQAVPLLPPPSSLALSLDLLSGSC